MLRRDRNMSFGAGEVEAAQALPASGQARMPVLQRRARFIVPLHDRGVGFGVGEIEGAQALPASGQVEWLCCQKSSLGAPTTLCEHYTRAGRPYWGGRGFRLGET